MYTPKWSLTPSSSRLAVASSPDSLLVLQGHQWPPVAHYCNGQQSFDAVENHVIYGSRSTINFSVNNSMRHAHRHTKGNEVDWCPYTVLCQVHPSRFIMISNSQYIAEDKTHRFQTVGNTRFWSKFEANSNKCDQWKTENIVQKWFYWYAGVSFPISSWATAKTALCFGASISAAYKKKDNKK